MTYLAAILLTAVVVGGIAYLLGHCHGAERTAARWAAAEAERAERERGKQWARRSSSYLNLN